MLALSNEFLHNAVSSYLELRKPDIPFFLYIGMTWIQIFKDRTWRYIMDIQFTTHCNLYLLCQYAIFLSFPFFFSFPREVYPIELGPRYIVTMLRNGQKLSLGIYIKIRYAYALSADNIQCIVILFFPDLSEENFDVRWGCKSQSKIFGLSGKGLTDLL